MRVAGGGGEGAGGGGEGDCWNGTSGEGNWRFASQYRCGHVSHRTALSVSH